MSPESLYPFDLLFFGFISGSVIDDFPLFKNKKSMSLSGKGGRPIVKTNIF